MGLCVPLGYLPSAGVDWGEGGGQAGGLDWKGRARFAVSWYVEGGVLLEGSACNIHKTGLTLKIIKNRDGLTLKLQFAPIQLNS